jgi:hypothetical protein
MEVARWMVENDRMYGRSDTFERAMKEHDRREHAGENYERMLLADPFVRQQAELDGVLVRCTIAKHTVSRVRGNSREIAMTLDAPPSARLRVGDVYSHVDNDRLRLRIDRVRRQQGRTRIEATSVGVQKAAADEVGRDDEILVGVAGGDFRFVSERARKRIFGSSVNDDDPYRLPCTHDPELRIDVPRGDGAEPDDPLEALEAVAK